MVHHGGTEKKARMEDGEWRMAKNRESRMEDGKKCLRAILHLLFSILVLIFAFVFVASRLRGGMDFADSVMYPGGRIPLRNFDFI
jgi:hypothetical protein